MIVSVSRRTDIPAFYFDWFCNRLQNGYVDVVNPFNRKQVSRVSIKSEAVDVPRRILPGDNVVLF